MHCNKPAARKISKGKATSELEDLPNDIPAFEFDRVDMILSTLPFASDENRALDTSEIRRLGLGSLYDLF